MKRFKYLASAALALAFTASAYSQTVIRIVASNGDRTATQTAISKLLDKTAVDGVAPGVNGWAFQGTAGYYRNNNDVITGTGASPTLKALVTDINFGAWKGKIQTGAAFGAASGLDVIIKVSFSGALAGIQAVAGGASAPQRFVTVDGSGTTAPPNPLTSATFELGTADFGFSTNFQSTSPFSGLFQGVNYSNVVQENVGISPLGFYGSAGFPGSPSSSNPSYVPNITTQLAQQLYLGGSISLAQITGDWTNDKDKRVYAIGRNVDAGQRFGAYLENGIGFNQVVNVVFPTITGATTSGSIVYGGTVDKIEKWPVATQPGSFAVALGSGGYSSGALLAAPLTATLSSDAFKYKYFDEDLQQDEFLFPDATAGYFIGYLTPGDADPRVLGTTNVVPPANRGVALTYNGVANTVANVKNGTYTAWLYNRILKPASLTTGPVYDFANKLRDQIKNVDAVAGGGFIDDATNFVKRTADGGPVKSK